VAFTVSDFHDLVQLLEQHPEWRAELRRLVLTEDELGLSAALERLADAQARADQRLEAAVAALTEAQARTEEGLAKLAERLERFTVRVDERFDRVDERFDRVEERLDRAETSVGRLLGSDVERRYRERAVAYFSRVVRRPRPLSPQQVADLLDGPESDGRLTDDERSDLLLADVVVRGRAEAGDGDVYLVVEVSVTIDPHDVERASRRAGLLERLHTTRAVVAGESITPDAEELAQARGVWSVLHGPARPPEVRAG